MIKTLQYLDPTTLTVGTNVRLDARLDAPFLASIKERGVLEPVLAHQDLAAGLLVVDQGQRRTLAAAKLELPTIPVLIDDQVPKDADRLVDQWVENEHRASLSNSERIRAVEQMALVGLTAGQIAKRTASSKADVAHAQAAAASPTAVKFADQFSLVDVALIAEFEGDEDAQERLLERVGSVHGLAAEAQRIRDDRAEQEVLAATTRELEATGVTVIEPPGYGTRNISRLIDLIDVDPDEHASCPGHVVWLLRNWSAGTSSKAKFRAQPGCRDYTEHGHTTTRTYYDSYDSSPKKTAAEMSDAEREKARLERKHVIESNKDWKAATTVRRRWLTGFLQRKTAPDGAEALLAAAIVGGWRNDVSQYVNASDSLQLLNTSKEALNGELATAAPKRALQIALALTVASWEASTADDLWRATDSRHAVAVRVLEAISQWGHQLSDIEARIVDGTASQPVAA